MPKVVKLITKKFDTEGEAYNPPEPKIDITGWIQFVAYASDARGQQHGFYGGFMEDPDGCVIIHAMLKEKHPGICHISMDLALPMDEAVGHG